MTREQEKALDIFAEKAKDKGVHIMICMITTSIMLSSEDWHSTLNDISAILDASKNAEEFERRLINKYPGQSVAKQG